jgi:hypothetical protein
MCNPTNSLPLSTTTYYGTCMIHGAYQSAAPGCPQCGQSWVWVVPTPQPPPVCTGSGHPPGATIVGAGFTGTCGICRREVALLWTGESSIIATHPYEPKDK